MKITALLVILAQVLPAVAKTQIESDTSKENSYSFKREIPKLQNGEPPSYYMNKSNVEHLMGLKSLENGSDSIELRLWYAYARTDSSQLIILVRKDNRWSARLITFVYLLRDDGKSMKTRNKKERPGSPKSGWTRFIQALYKFSVPTLPDENEIKNYPEYADGNSIIVEVATKNSYRIYSYKEPIHTQAKIKDARKIEQALSLIEDQFGFKRLHQI